MRKVAIVFIIAVVAPSLVLAGLALRSLRGQRLAAERQETLLAEAAAGELARNFRDIIGDSPGGTVARFVQDELQILLWHRNPADPAVVLGAQVRLGTFIPRLAAAIRMDSALADRFTAVLRDDSQLVAAFSGREDAHRSGARPMAAADIGDKLPHWRVEIFPSHPGLAQAAVRTEQFTIALLVGVLLLAMGVGSWLIVHDLQRQLLFPRQKTDFVSNVSHELKTPLTSIRMFAELLEGDADLDPASRRKFVQVIQTEAARLTRLLDNVLDFGRLEQNRHTHRLRSTDLVEVARTAAEACRP